MSESIVSQNGPPRRFLKKGEGLKRFAAYKPPLPTTVKKVERRQTFVRFKLDHNNPKLQTAHFLNPEILNDDSINLSTEIPKIAPPKIIHTPIRPNRHALGTITNESNLFTDSQINGNIDNLLKKIEQKKSSLPGKNGSDYEGEDSFYQLELDQHHTCGDFTPSPPLPSTPSPTSPEVQKPTVAQTDTNRTHGSSTSLPGNCLLALGEQIQRIEQTVIELREKMKNCECGVLASPPNRRRPTTRAAARAAKSKASDKSRPSANADKDPTPQVIISLINEIAQLKAKFDDMNPID